MAKTESTAVNDLIKIAATQTPLAKDPSDDLMFTIPPKGRDRSTQMVAPLPPARAPHGTKEHAIAMPAMKAGGSPAKGTATVPPMPQVARPRMPLPPPLPGSKSSIPVPPIAASRSSIPVPPIPPSRPSMPVPPIAVAPIEAPEFLSESSSESLDAIDTNVVQPALPPMRASLPPPSRPALPSEYPVVSAVHSLPMAPAPQPKIADAVVTPWADDDNSIDIDASEFRGDSTAQVPRPRTNLEWVIKLAPWMGVMVVIGVFIGGYIVFDGQGGQKRAAAAAPETASSVEVKVVADLTNDSPAPAIAAVAVVPTESVAAPVAVTPPNLAAATEEPKAAVAPTAQPTPAVPSIAAPAPTAGAIAKRPVFIDVRIDSNPTGATVTLVDRGKQTFLGTTPISTAVDPSRAYEIVFAHPRRPTQTVSLDPKTTTRLAVTLGRSGRATTELAPPVAAAKPVAIAKPVTIAKVATPTAVAPKTAKVAKPAKIIEPTWGTEAPKTVEKAAAPAPAPAPEKVAAPAAEKAVGGNGVLMISSKPPCEIHIDGKATGLMTPQRSMPLAAGKHKITLVNATEKIKKTITVDITANETSKVIQNLMQ